ncbi:Aste57867_24040 [Aphanomyces stellatus]|uniref:Aste57867_24040 protein n=1 Tax=Aphanomyces stellatus TaxID=120398 RepID=A0A485LPL6_9STRA|nr:hypothetical protein As57867_023967 [Aphanomyces stellatus]VFU00683.1 Aste57867_24040 [Aphanomyces stellatus]
MPPPTLFSPIQVGALHLRNRIFMAPLMRTRTGADHAPSAIMADYYAQRASAGLIVTEWSMVAPHTAAYDATPGLFNDTQAQAWAKITHAVHATGGAIFSQLNHPGRASHPALNGGVVPVAPSAIAIDATVQAKTPQGRQPHVVPHALSVDEISSIVEAFAAAATRAVDVAGFDGVELHGANGYLIDQFLNPQSNHRTDGYGGSVAHRTRFLAEVLAAVTDAVGSNRVGIRLAPLNNHNSMTDDDVCVSVEEVAKLCDAFELAYVHVRRQDFFQLHAPRDMLPIYRRHFRRGVLIGNAEYSQTEANEAIENGHVDAVAFGTAFLANPDLPARFATQAALNPADPATFYAGGNRGYTDYPSLTSS